MEDRKMVRVKGKPRELVRLYMNQLRVKGKVSKYAVLVNDQSILTATGLYQEKVSGVGADQFPKLILKSFLWKYIGVERAKEYYWSGVNRK